MAPIFDDIFDDNTYCGRKFYWLSLVFQNFYQTIIAPEAIVKNPKCSKFAQTSKIGPFLPWRPQFWPETKMTRRDFAIMFDEVDETFSCLRLVGDGIYGGWGSNTPQQVVENPDAQQRASWNLHSDYLWLAIALWLVWHISLCIMDGFSEHPNTSPKVYIQISRW